MKIFWLKPPGLRCLIGAAFASLSRYAAHRDNSDFVGTEPNEAPYETTGNNVEYYVDVLV